MITLKGTTVTISSSFDALNQALSEALTQCDIQQVNIEYEARKKRIKKEWRERKELRKSK